MPIRECLAALLLMLGACADLPVSPQSTPLPRGPLTNSAEYGEGPTDAPKEWPVRIHTTLVSVSLPDAIVDPSRPAEAFASMNYDAYHASISANTILREKDGTVIQRQFPPRFRHTSSWSYRNQSFQTNFPVLVRSLCGGSLEADVTFRAWWWGVNLEGTPQALEIKEQSDTDNRSQDACEPCTKTGVQPVRNVTSDGSYDPYDEGSDAEGCDDSDGGGDSGGGGSGTQFGEGDSTGGETVDWGTGVGNGGTSGCGLAAIVRYVCIDIFVDGEWKQYSCGWATTC